MTNSDKNFEKIIHLMQTDDSVDAPEDAINWSKNLFKTRSAEQKVSLKSIVATLVRELGPGTVMGERSASVGRVRQLLFEAGENRVDLRITSNQEGFDLRGQILGRGWDDAKVNMAGQAVSVDKFGSFVLSNLQEGTFDLTIQGTRIDIVMKDIELVK